MKLRGNSGDSIEIRIAGYQFPDGWDNEYDANWLLVDTVADVGGRSWTSRDACLLTWEVEWLAAWLEGVAKHESTDSESRFLEPNLRFELCGEVDGRAHIRCYFELENRPRWAPPDGAGMDDLWADLHCLPEEIMDASADLREQRDRFPTRAGVGRTRDKPGGSGV